MSIINNIIFNFLPYIFSKYLQPTKMHYGVVEFVHPDIFAKYKEVGESKGFDIVESSPLVRSSYHAEKHL